MKEHLNNLEFKIAVSKPEHSQFSLKISDADFSYNQLLLNNIVGTLVKYGPSGKIEPYLAKSWTTSQDNKIWEFTFRDNLFAENGTKITASSFHKALVKNLKFYSKNGSVIVFDHILGWDEFLKGDGTPLKGLSVTEKTIKFEFDSSPDAFLELLRMPYFGFWLEENNKLISTGSYSLKNINTNRVNLSLREDWFTVSNESVKNVTISFSKIDDGNIAKEKNAIIRFPFYADTSTHGDFGYWIVSPPTRLECFTLSPKKINFFHEKHNRILFNNKIRNQSSGNMKSDFFYQSAKSHVKIDSKPEKYVKVSNVKPIEFALERMNYSQEELENINYSIKKALEGSGVKFNILERDTLDKDWFKKTDSNEYFDARVTSVDIGAYPIYTAIKMMFCTKLGVNFPDPSGKICELIANNVKKSIQMDQDFITKFNQIIYDDAVIIPIQFHSDKWYVTNNIDPKSMPPTTLYPQFELIRFR